MDNTVLLSLRGLKAWAGRGDSGAAVAAEAGCTHVPWLQQPP